jgi:hypothetical protein
MTTQQTESGKRQPRKETRTGRLALCKGEGEDEGFARQPPSAASEPLTSVLSPWTRGEEAEIRIDGRDLR